MVVAHAAGLLGAAWGVGLRVEVEHHALTAEVGELDLAPILVGEGEVGGNVTLVDHVGILDRNPCLERTRSSGALCRPRRGPCNRRTARRAEGVCDVAGEVARFRYLRAFRPNIAANTPHRRVPAYT